MRSKDTYADVHGMQRTTAEEGTTPYRSKAVDGTIYLIPLKHQAGERILRRQPRVFDKAARSRCLNAS